MGFSYETLDDIEMEEGSTMVPPQSISPKWRQLSRASPSLRLSKSRRVAVAGILLGMTYLGFESGWSGAVQRQVLGVDFGLGVTALTAAAFLRWFS